MSAFEEKMYDFELIEPGKATESIKIILSNSFTLSVAMEELFYEAYGKKLVGNSVDGREEDEPQDVPPPLNAVQQLQQIVIAIRMKTAMMRTLPIMYGPGMPRRTMAAMLATSLMSTLMPASHRA